MVTGTIVLTVGGRASSGDVTSILQSMLPPEQAKLDTYWLVQIRGANKKGGGEGVVFAQRPWLFRALRKEGIVE